MVQRLESLKVTSDFVSSDYVRGMQAKIAADKAGAASSRDVGSAVTDSVTKVSDAGGAIGRLSRQYVEGAGQAQRFTRDLAALGREIDRDASAIGRAEAVLEGLYRKTGFAADASVLMERGQIGLAVAVQNVNNKIAAQAEILDRQARSAAAAGQAQKSQSFINNWAGVSQQADSGMRTADIQAYGQALDQTRAKFDPLFRLQQQYRKELGEINEAYKTGAISEKTRAEAITRTKDAFAAGVTQLKTFGTQAGLTSFQLANMGYQINDIATGLAMGQSPFMILAQQGGQVYQILSQSPQGVGGAIRQVGSMIGGIVTPLRLAVGGITALAGAGLLAQNNFRNSQIEIELALTGIGRAAGVTVDDVNRIGEAAARVSRLSTGEARTVAAAIASSGRVPAENLEQAVHVAEDLAKVLGIDVAEAGKTLAKVFADPSRGAEELNQRLGAIDATTMRTIRNLAEQGKLQQANLVITRAIEGSIKGSVENTTDWAKGWNLVTNLAKNAWTSTGQALDRALGGGTLQDQLSDARAELERLQSFRDPFGWFTSSIDAQIVKINELEARVSQAQRQFENTARNDQSNLFAKALDRLAPERAAQEALGNIRSLVARIDPNDTAMIRTLGLTPELLALLKSRAENAFATFADSQARALKQSQIALQAVGARSPAELAAVARSQALEQLRGQSVSPDEARIRADAQATVAYAQAMRQLTDAARDRVASVRDAIGQSEIDISIIGKGIGQAELLRSNWQSFVDLRREAERNNTQFDEAQYQRLVRENAELARKKQLVAEANLTADLQFQRDQLFRSPTEQAVHQQLRPIYGDDLSSAQAQFLAQQIRINEALRESSEIGRGAFKGFIADIRAGKTGLEALGGALNRVADKLVDMAIDNVWSSAFGGAMKSGGLFSWLSPGGSGMAGTGGGLGDVWAGLRHTGLDAGPASATGPGRFIHPAYVENAPRKHGGLRPGERAQVVLDGEETGWPHQFREKYGKASAGSASGRLHITTGVEVDGNGSISAYVKRVAQTEGLQAATTVVKANEKSRAKQRQAGGDPP